MDNACNREHHQNTIEKKVDIKKKWLKSDEIVTFQDHRSLKCMQKI